MKAFFGDLKKIICDWRCSVPVILTALFSFGWQLVRFNIGIDDTVRSRYLNGGLFSQGRFSSTIVSYMFGQWKAMPFIEPFLAVLFLIAASFLMILLLKRASHGLLSRGATTFFACIFISYPLISEIFVYKGSDLYAGIGYFLCAVSLLAVSGIFEKSGAPSSETEAIGPKKRRRSIILRLLTSTLISIFLVSLYEAFAAVYLVLVSLFLFTEIIFSGRRPGGKTYDPKTDNTKFVRKFFIYISPMLLGIILEYLIGLILTGLFDFGINIPAGSGVYIPSSLSSEYFVNMFYSIFRKLFFAGLWYYPIRVFAIGVLIMPAFFIGVGVYKRRASVLLCAGGLLAGLFGIAVISGGSVKYRTCLSFAPFVAFFFMLLFHYAALLYKRGLSDSAKKFKTARVVVRNIAVFLMVFTVCFQIAAMNSYFFENDMRWKEEKAVLVECGEALEKLDLGDKPVIFIGSYTLSERVMRSKFVRYDDPTYKVVKQAAANMGFSLSTTDYDEEYVVAMNLSDFGSVITWGIEDRFSCNEELLLVFKELGYSFKQGTMERYEELSETADLFPAFNGTGEITELPDCFVVRFK